MAGRKAESVVVRRPQRAADISSVKVTRDETVVQVMRQLEEQRGFVQPADLVQVAAPLDSPIHDMFEWDDTKAGVRYRLHQARMIINHVQVELVDDKRSDAFYSAVVQVDDVPTRGYFSAEKVLSDDELYASVLNQAIRELKYWQKKYKTITELKGVVDEARLALASKRRSTQPARRVYARR